MRGRPRGSWTGSQWSWIPAGCLAARARSSFTTRRRRGRSSRAGGSRAYGPALVEDLKWWSGWSLTHTRSALAAAGAVEVDLEGVTGVALPDDDAPTRAAGALGGPDPRPSTRRSWAGSTATGTSARTPRRCSTAAGNAGPSVWWDGRVVGGWAQRKGGEIVFRLLEDVGADAAAAVEADAERLAAWIGETRTLPRFRTPLERELTA